MPNNEKPSADPLLHAKAAFWAHASNSGLSHSLASACSDFSGSGEYEDENSDSFDKTPLSFCRTLDLIARDMGLPSSQNPPFPFLSFNVPENFDDGACLNQYCRPDKGSHPLIVACRFFKSAAAVKTLLALGSPPVIQKDKGNVCDASYVAAREGLSGALAILMAKSIESGAEPSEQRDIFASWLSGCASTPSPECVAEAAEWIPALGIKTMPLALRQVFQSPFVGLVCREFDTPKEEHDAKTTLAEFLKLAPFSSWSMEPDEHWTEWVETPPESSKAFVLDAITSGSAWAVCALFEHGAEFPSSAELTLMRDTAEASNQTDKSLQMATIAAALSLAEHLEIESDVRLPSTPLEPLLPKTRRSV